MFIDSFKDQNMKNVYLGDTLIPKILPVGTKIDL